MIYAQIGDTFYIAKTLYGGEFVIIAGSSGGTGGGAGEGTEGTILLLGVGN